MAKTSKLGLTLIDENSTLSSSVINENNEIVSRAINGTTLTNITQGSLVDNDVFNNNWQIIDNAWLDTSDATASANTIRSGYTAYVKGSKVTGTYVPLDTSDATASASTIRSGYTAYVKGSKVTGTYVPPAGVQLQVSTYCSITNPLNNGVPILSFYVPGIKTTNTLINFCASISYYYNGTTDSNGNKYHGIIGGVIRNSYVLDQPYTTLSGVPGVYNGFQSGAIARIWVPQDNYIYVEAAYVLHGGSFNANVLTSITPTYFEATWY